MFVETLNTVGSETNGVTLLTLLNQEFDFRSYFTDFIASCIDQLCKELRVLKSSPTCALLICETPAVFSHWG